MCRVLLALVLMPGLSPVAGCTVTNGIAIGVRNEVFSRQKRTDYKYDPDFGVEDPQFRRSIDSVASQMVDGNTVDLLRNGDQIFPAMTADIRNAKVSVNLETYIYVDDEAGRQFADAMIEAARRGVQVRLLVDDWGSDLGGLEDELEDAGVLVEHYRPLRPYSLHRPGIRTHRKLLIVDGRIGYTGGLGIDKRWLGNARNPDEWRDTQVRVTGPVVAQMQAIFGQDWTFQSAEVLAGDAFYPELQPTGHVLAHAVSSTKGDPASIPKLMYLLAIQSARRYIHIQNPYFIPDEQVRRSLVKAARRGVDVVVMVPGRHNDMPTLRQGSRFHYGQLLKGGVKIYEYVPTMMHHKTVIVDDIFSTIGSINFDARSMQINNEESLSVYDRDFAARMEAMFRHDLQNCHLIRYEEWKNRGFVARSAEWISWIWEPYY